MSIEGQFAPYQRLQFDDLDRRFPAGGSPEAPGDAWLWEEDYSAEAMAVFAAFTTPPTTARKDLINASIVALKTAGVWPKLDVLLLTAAADRQAAKINWKAPGTFNAVEVSIPNFVADRGFTSVIAAAYVGHLDSQFNPTTAGGGFTLNNAHQGVWGPNVQGATELGNYDAGAGSLIQNWSGLGFYPYPNSSGAVAHTEAVGHQAWSRGSSTTFEKYQNRSLLVAATQASLPLANAPFALCALALPGGTVIQFSTNQNSAFHWGGALTQTEMNALYDALFAYLHGVGAA